MSAQTPRNQQQAAPLVYLVVLNWNGFDDTHECLLSLQALDYPHYRVLVVDNGSNDDSPSRIQAEHPDVELVLCHQNRGIAAGYNRGIEAALARGADSVVVMNNDLICDPRCISEMVAIAQASPRCAIVMPKIYYYDERDRIWSAGAYARWLPSNIVLRGRRETDNAAYYQPQSLDFAPSCCLLLTRELCERITFDEQYFFYFDDWDFCVQARQAQRQIMFAPDAHIWHKVSQSTQNSPKSLRWWKILGQSSVRYHQKHHSTRLLALYIGYVVLRETAKGNIGSLPTFLRGVTAGLRARTIHDIQPGWSR